MFEVFLKNITEKIDLTNDECSTLTSFLQMRKLRKRQYLLQEGDACKHMSFVETGLLRMYSVDDKGIEHMMQFAIEGWWIVDVSSFFTGEPSRYNIDVLEDADLVQLNKGGFESMMAALPKMEKYFRVLYQNNIIAKERRLEGSTWLSAEDRYLQFQKMYPRLAVRIPLNLIASYLGITPETLSRIRRNLMK